MCVPWCTARGSATSIPMKPYKKVLFSVSGIVVLACLAFIPVKTGGPAHREKVKKERTVGRIAEYMRTENAELEECEVKLISRTIYEESVRYNVDYRLVLALMKIESNFMCDAVSEQGARGLLQVKPSLARHIAADAGVSWQGKKTLHEPETNIRIGVHFFSKLVRDFRSTNMALHAYHVGPTRLREIITARKTPAKRYLNLVLDEYDRNVSLLPAQ